MTPDLDYEDIDPETGEKPVKRWGKSAQDKPKKLRINTYDPEYKRAPGVQQVVALIAELTGRTYWNSDTERGDFLRAFKKHTKREYASEYWGWLVWCLKELGPEKGWTMQRLIEYLGSEDRYVGKLGMLKARRDQAEGKSLNIKKGGKALGPEDFLDEVEE